MIVSELAQKSLTLGGTAERVQAEASALHVEAVFFSCPSTNTSVVNIGSSSVSTTRFVCSISPGGSFSIAVPPSAQADGAEIKLQDLYWVSATTGDKLNVGYMTNQP